ncbi:MAG: glycosyltransferase [Acidimicrobiales bacterium]
MSTVSVIVPCYNYARFLRACIESVLAQEGVELSVLIIDDCSTDDSQAVGEALAAGDARLAYRRHEVNHRHIATYNEGFDWASGDYTILLSADDLLTPGALRRSAGLMDAHPEVGFVYGRTIFLREGKRTPAPRIEHKGWKIWKGAEWIEKRCEATTNNISSPEVLLRTSLVKTLGGFRPELPHTADLEFWMQCAALADVGYVRGAHQAYYRKHGASMLHQHFNAPLIDLQQRKAAFDALFDVHGHRIPDAGRLRSLANKGLAQHALWGASRAYERGRLDKIPADELIAFAKETCPGAESLGAYSALRRRQRLGPRYSLALQPVSMLPLVRRIRDIVAWQAVQRRGV